MKGSLRSQPLPWMVGLVHVALALLLAGRWLEVTRLDEAYLLAIPCAQLSLIAVWCASARAPAWLRLPALLLGTAAMAFVFLRANHSRGPDESAGWTVALMTQALGVAIGVTTWRVLRVVSRQRSGRALAAGAPEHAQESESLRYSLRTLILWITALAVLLGVGREVLARVGWTTEVLKWDYFLFMPVLGAFRAVYAMLVLATLVGRDRWPARMALGLLLVGAIGYSESFVLTALFGRNGGLEWPITLTWALGQAGVLYATLLPLGDESQE